MDPPKTPPDKILNTTPNSPPALHVKTPPPRISCDINTRDELGPLYWENRDKTPDFEVPPLEEGDFKERPTVEEWADRLGLKLPSGESVLSGRPDPSELKPGAKLPPSIEEIDRLLTKGERDPMYLGPISEPKSKAGALIKSAESSHEKAEGEDLKQSPHNLSNSNVGLGAMLPPPLPAPRVPRKEPDRETLQPQSEKSNKSKEKVAAVPQLMLRNAALLQEMADMANPLQAEEDRAKDFMNRLPRVQAASRRLQGHLDIHGDETWPLPPLPSDRNPFILEINANKIRTALDNCKDFAVTTDRESVKSGFLDVAAKNGEKRQVDLASPSRLRALEEKKAREAKTAIAIENMMAEGLEDELNELKDEGMSEVPSTPKSLFHSVVTIPQTSQESAAAATGDEETTIGSQEGAAAATGDEETTTGSQESSSVDTAERERREEWEELTRNPRFRGIGPYGVPEYDGPSTSDSNRSDATGGTPSWVYDENATPNPHYDSEGNSVPFNTPTASSDDQEMRTPTQETDIASAVSEHALSTLNPPSLELRTLSVRGSELEGTRSMTNEALAFPSIQDKGKGGETSPRIRETRLDGPEATNISEWAEEGAVLDEGSSYFSEDQDKGKGKQMIPDFIGDAGVDDGTKRHRKTMGLRGERLDVAASLRNHSITLADVNQPKAKERNPPVPRPENMPNTLTEAICSYIPLEAKSILTLTFERVDSPVPSPTDRRCILLKHFEVGLDGVEGLCQGTAKIPETTERTAERERRIGKIGTFKQGDGGFYRALKRAQQKEQQYGKGYWYFFGVKFKQTHKEKKLRRGGKWLLFGAPIEAVYHMDIKRNQENVAVMLGGGVDKSGNAVNPFKANFKRTHTLFSRGGIAPMDIWAGGEDWDDGVFKDIRAAMAHNGLRVGFLYADTQTFTPRPLVIPTAGKNQSEKKRKESGPDMTVEEMKAMEKSMKPKQSRDEEIGTILTTKIINDRAKRDAAERFR